MLQYSGILGGVYLDYSKSVQEFLSKYGTIIFVIEMILAIILIIALICLVIGKMKKSNNLLNKSAKICENSLYYLISVLGLANAIFMFQWRISKIEGTVTQYSYFKILIFLSAILPLFFVCLSLFFRLKEKDKKFSYVILLMYLMFIIGFNSGNVM